MRDNTVKDYDGNSLDTYEHKIYVLADIISIQYF